MNFAFSEEQEELRRITRQFLESKSPEAEVRRLMDTDEGYDPAVWSQMANELGLQSLIIPEEYGGQGFTFVELTVVLEEMGRALLCAPYFSSCVLAASALLHSGDDAAKKEHLPGIASGETIATLAFTEPNGKWDESGIEATATKDGDGYKLNGTKMFVLDGAQAGLLIVAAKSDAGVSLFAVDPNGAGVTRTNLATMDQTRKQAKIELADAPATLIGTEGAGWATLERVLDLAAVALAAEQVGGAQKVLETAVQYAKDRVQFGRPIGSFQAIKHKCADMLLEVESAKSRRLLRRLVRRRAQRRAPVGRQPGQGLLLRGVLPRRRREHPDPRRHRLHLGAPRPPLLQAGQVVASCCSATRPTTASSSPSASGSSDRRSPGGLRAHGRPSGRPRSRRQRTVATWSGSSSSSARCWCSPSRRRSWGRRRSGSGTRRSRRSSTWTRRCRRSATPCPRRCRPGSPTTRCAG